MAKPQPSEFEKNRMKKFIEKFKEDNHPRNRGKSKAEEPDSEESG